MPDYKEMYLKIFRASERAVNILVAVQQECEEHYISSSKPGIRVTSPPTENNKGTDEK